MSISASSHRFCIAPMLDWSDRHARYFWRLLSKNARVYTEMVTTGALLHRDPARFLQFNHEEHPIALQLGGSDPKALAECARLAESWGYDEINLNVGCPSDRVQNGQFGACLMANAPLVADCVSAMKSATTLPVTVKCRIGIDEQDSYAFLQQFVARIVDSGCDLLIVHARKVWLSGLSPKQNREIPPLDYERVATLKQDFPALPIILNGGIETLDACEQQLQRFDGVMLGRRVYHDPYVLAEVDQRLFQSDAVIPDRDTILQQFIAYTDEQLERGERLQSLTRHMLGLYHGQPGGRIFRRILSEQARLPNADSSVLRQAHEAILSARQTATLRSNRNQTTALEQNTRSA